MDIKNELKEIELAIVKGLSQEAIVKHVAELQTKFESLETKVAEITKERDNQLAYIVKLEKDLDSVQKTYLQVLAELNNAKSTIKEMEKNDWQWKIERQYTEGLISTLKELFSAALTRTAIKGESFLNFSSYLPGQYGQGNVTGSGNATKQEEVIKPEIK